MIRPRYRSSDGIRASHTCGCRHHFREVVRTVTMHICAETLSNDRLDMKMCQKVETSVKICAPEAAPVPQLVVMLPDAMHEIGVPAEPKPV